MFIDMSGLFLQKSFLKTKYISRMIANKEEKKFFDIFLVFNLSFCIIATSSMQHTLFKATTHLKSMT